MEANMPRIRAVIMDLIGVYFNDPRREIMKAISDYTRKSLGEVSHVFTRSNLNTALKTGSLTFEEYVDLASHAIDYKGNLYNELQWEDVWFGKYKPRDGIEDLVDEVREKGRKVVSLSDNFRELVHHMDGIHQFTRHFDTCVWSYDSNVHVRKPSRKIYVASIEAAGCEGYQTVFLDDNVTNCHAARGLGMNAVPVDAKKGDAAVVQSIRDKLRGYGIRMRKS